MKELLSCEQTPSWNHPSLSPLRNPALPPDEMMNPYSCADCWTISFINRRDVGALSVFFSFFFLSPIQAFFPFRQARTSSPSPPYFCSFFHPHSLPSPSTSSLQSRPPVSPPPSSHRGLSLLCLLKERGRQRRRGITKKQTGDITNKM